MKTPSETRDHKSVTVLRSPNGLTAWSVSFILSIVIIITTIHYGHANEIELSNQSINTGDRYKARFLQPSINLTKQEKQFITKNPSINIGIIRQNKPISQYQFDKASGYLIDILDLVSQQVGISFKWVAANDPKDLQRLYLDQKIMAFIYEDLGQHYQDRISSQTLLTSVIAIYSRPQQDTTLTLNSLAHRKISAVKDSAIASMLRKHYPNIHVVDTDSDLHSLKMAASGDVYASVNNAIVTEYLLGEHYIPNLELAGIVNVYNQNISQVNFKIAINSNFPSLRSLINRSYKNISIQHKRSIQSKWIDPKNFREHPSNALSNSDFQYLQSIAPLTICSDKNFKSLNQGIWDTINQSLNIEYTINAKDANKDSILSSLNECDIWPIFGKNPAWKDTFTFSKTIYEFQPVLVISRNSPYKIFDHVIKSETIAVLDKNTFSEHIIKNHPQSDIIKVNGISAGFEAIRSGAAYGLVMSPLGFNHAINKHEAYDLTIGPNFHIDNTIVTSSAIPKHKKHLANIIVKAIDSIPSTSFHQLINSYINREDNKTHPILKQSDIDYLNNRPAINVCIDDNFKKAQMIYWDQINQYLKLSNYKIKFYDIDNPPIFSCDLWPLLSPSKFLQKHLSFTKPIYETNLLLAVKKSTNDIVDLRSIENEKIAVFKQYPFKHLIQSYYPDLELIEVKGIPEGFESILKGEVVGLILPPAIYKNATIFIDSQDFKVGAYLPSDLLYTASAATQKLDYRLTSIIERTINSIPQKAILNTLQTAISNKEQTIISQADQEYLATISPLTICVDKNHSEIQENMWTPISKKMHVSYTYKSVSLDNIDDPNCDAWPAMAISDKRKISFNFSRPIYKTNLAVITLKDNKSINNPNDLPNYRIGIIKNRALKDYIRTSQPTTKILELDTASTAMRYINNRKIDAWITPPLSFHKIQIDSNSSNAHIAFMLMQDNGYQGAVAVLKRKPELSKIINSIVDSIPQSMFSMHTIRQLGGIDIKTQIALTDIEDKYLSNHGDIKFCIPPTDKQLTQDFWNLFNRQLKLPFRFIYPATNKILLTFLEDGDCDLLTLLGK